MLNSYCYGWLIGIPLIYYGLINYFDKNNLYQKRTINNNKENTIVSQILTSTVCVIYLSISGLILYMKHSDKIINKDYYFASDDNIINHLIIPMICYQGWNTIITFFNKDLYSFLYIVHHLVAILGCIIGLINYFQYYTIIYFGLIEISNIFLSVIEYSRYEKYIEENKVLYNLNNIFFIISFYILRIILFQIYTINILIILIYERSIFFQNKYILQSLCTIVSFSILSYLQFLWGYKIYKKIIETINKIE
jgi:hypothetical protein